MNLNIGPMGSVAETECTSNGGSGVDLFHPYNLSWEGTAGNQSSVTDVSVYVCDGRRPLRQKQRDDYFNAPRNKNSHNNPTSRQDSLRSSPGGNTYL